MNRSAKTFTLEGHKVMLLQYITTDLNDLLSGFVCMELSMTSTPFYLKWKLDHKIRVIRQVHYVT